MGSSFIAGSNVETLGVQEVSSPNLPANVLTAGVSITFNISNVNVGDTIKVLHKKSTDNQWEVLNTTVEAGKVTATFNSFSPVVFVRITGGNIASNVNSDNTDAASTSAAITSPKTGFNGFIYIVELIAAVSFVGIVVVSKRKVI